MEDETGKPVWNDLRRFYHYFRPYRFRAATGLFFTSFLGVFDAAIAWLLAPYMDNVIIKSASDSTKLIQPWFFPVVIILFAVLQSMVNYAANYLTTWVGSRVGNDLRLDMFDKMTHMDSAFFDRTTSGEALVRFSADAQAATAGLLGNVKNFITLFVKSISLVAVMFYQSWVLTLVSVGVLLLVVVPMNRVRRKLKRYIKDSVQSGAILTTAFNESYSGNRIVTSYNLHSFVRERMRSGLSTFFRISIKMVQRSNVLSLAMHAATAVGLAMTMWLQEYLVRTGHITPGNLVSFLASLLMFYTPIKKIGNNIATFQTATMAIGRVLSIIDLTPTIVSKPDAVKLDGVRRGISFKDVSFFYNEGVPVLRHVSLDIEAGSSVAFVGNSGGGKTTLVNLVPRFYDVCEGSLTVAGVDVRDLDLDSLRAHIAIVFQDNFLFGGTIRENILLGKRDATEAELAAAVEAACLNEFIVRLEKGLDTEIGERGAMLSGGQKQRVAIARAFIKDAPIVILDEATSALDNKSERVVQQAIENLMLNKTVLIIAHRLSTVIHSDRIVVVQEGELAESGTHTELLAKDGVYASLYKTQLT